MQNVLLLFSQVPGHNQGNADDSWLGSDAINLCWGLKGPGLPQGDPAEEHGTRGCYKWVTVPSPLHRLHVANPRLDPSSSDTSCPLPPVPVTILTTALGSDGEVNCFLICLLCCLEEAGIQIKIRLSQ